MTFSGSYTPIVTTFAPDGSLDAAAMRSNAERYMRTTLTGLVVLGSNGEAPQLDDDEADRAIAAVREGVPSGKPLLAGTGRESTRATIAATRRAAALGADAVLVRTPAFFKSQMTTAVFLRHYTEVADASPVPVLLYNVTMYTGVNLLPDAVAALSEHPNIVGMKESGSDMAQFAEYLARVPEGFIVLAGAASTYFPALTLGAHGAILALAGVAPDLCTRIAADVAAGRLDEARALARRVAPLGRAIGAVHGVPGLKAALDLVGYHGGAPRPPLRPVSPDVVRALRGQLGALGLLEEDSDVAR
jgi:4-hydroxy-2-oxoglutarate aldolase